MARAGCLLVSGDEVLIIHEASFPKCSRKWGLPKGKVLPRETKFQAALRELEEEVGIRAADLPMPSTSFRRNNLVVFVFNVDRRRLCLVPDNREIDGAAWVPWAELHADYQRCRSKYNVTIAAVFEKYAP